MEMAPLVMRLCPFREGRWNQFEGQQKNKLATQPAAQVIEISEPLLFLKKSHII